MISDDLFVDDFRAGFPVRVSSVQTLTDKTKMLSAAAALVLAASCASADVGARAPAHPSSGTSGRLAFAAAARAPLRAPACAPACARGPRARATARAAEAAAAAHDGPTGGARGEALHDVLQKVYDMVPGSENQLWASLASSDQVAP
jgi:hypothetical protein